MFSKSTPKHRVCQVHQGCDYTRTKPAQGLELIEPGEIRADIARVVQIRVLAKLDWAACLKALLLTSFVSLLLLLDLKFIV